MAKKKVYCKNCKWNFVLLPDSYYCHRRIYDFVGRFTGHEKYHYIPKAVNNSEGNCDHYERKWWKFWVNDKQIGCICGDHEVGNDGLCAICRR